MRIAQVSTWQTHCGIAGYTELLTDALRELGVEVEVAPIDRSATRYLSRPELRGYFDQLADGVEGADLVHIQHEFGFFSGAYSWGTSLSNFRRLLKQLRRRRQPVVVTFHTDPDWFVRANGLLLDQVLQTGARLAWRTSVPALFGRRDGALAIAHSRTTRRHLIDAGITADAIEVIRQGIPRSGAADASEAARTRARAWLGLPRHARVLAVFGF